MTFHELGSIGEFVAAIATLITLVYLAIQIRQNTRIVRSTAFQQVVDSFSEISLAISRNRDLTEVFVRGRDGLSSLDPLEQERLRFALVSYFRRAESVYFHSEQGTLQMETWMGIRESLRRTLQGSGARELWGRDAHLYNPRFRSFIEAEILPSVEGRPTSRSS